jgi:hypothetical protein
VNAAWVFIVLEAMQWFFIYIACTYGSGTYFNRRPSEEAFKIHWN